ncbi:MAG: BRCT domain-containing protein [Candidatus Competibacteraceae bacterium]|nr:BRCT domain-containing protein [Chromatiaceae bacterium]MBP9602972.1 BRCT domain-containing protein [Chromatiaceae bacterium]
MLATNRQKKVLKFFGVRFHEKISLGAAGWELGTIFSDENNAEKWRRYLFLTRDFGADSADLLSYQEEQIERIQVPEDWSARKEIQKFHEEMAAHILASESPYDTPQPDIVFSGHSFCFTGKFDFGHRAACENVINEKGGTPAKGVSGSLDFLVIGTQGSPDWKRGTYGNKIEKAIVLRREHGKPVIVSEDHCFSFL